MVRYLVISLVLLFSCKTSSNTSIEKLKTDQSIDVQEEPNEQFNTSEYSANSPFETPEFYGALAYQKPLDGRVEFDIQFPLIDVEGYSSNVNAMTGTPYENKPGYSLVTAKNKVGAQMQGVFTMDDIGKTFFVLAGHQNPAIPNFSNTDEYYPNETTVRYAKVVHLKSSSQIIVDFDYNGGDFENPRKIENGQGRIFYDNSEAFDKMYSNFFSIDNNKEYLKFKPLTHLGNYVIQAYQLTMHKSRHIPTHKKVWFWTGSNNRARINPFYEDYCPLFKRNGNNKVNAASALFIAPKGNIQFVSHNIEWTGAMHQIGASPTFAQLLVRSESGNKNGVIAFHNLFNQSEKEAIARGIGSTENLFYYLQPFSTMRGGSVKKNEKNPLLNDVDRFLFFYFSDGHFNGSFSAGSGTGSGKDFMIFERCRFDFRPQSFWNPPAQLLEGVIATEDYEGEEWPEYVRSNHDHYLPYVFKITSSGNTRKTITKGGGNRSNFLNIKRKGENRGFVFSLTPQGSSRPHHAGDFPGYYEWCYSNQRPPQSWNVSKKQNADYASTLNKFMLWAAIPEVGKKYTISRHYEIKEGYKKISDRKGASIPTPRKIKEFPRSVRTAVCWTTVLRKYAIDLDPDSDIPENGIPLELQVGDKFRILGSNNPNIIYTVIRKDRMNWPEFAAEFVLAPTLKELKNKWPDSGWKDAPWNNLESYHAMYLLLDRELPDDLGITFEIEIVKSTSEYLLKEKEPQQALSVYKDNQFFGEHVKFTDIKSPQNETTNWFDEKGLYGINGVFSGNDNAAYGHLAYVQGDLTRMYVDCDFDKGFWRENKGQAAKGKFKLNDGTKVNEMHFYPKGWWFIRCKNPPIGQLGNSSKSFWEEQRKIISQELYNQPDFVEREELQYPPKIRIYGGDPFINRHKKLIFQPENAEYSLEIYSTDENAPDLPKSVRILINDISSKMK